MTSLEFSNEFEILYNNIMSNQSPGIDLYEKSVLLTKAQLELVKNYFNPKGNKYQEGYDDSAKRYYDFSVLNTTVKFIIGSNGNLLVEDVNSNTKSIITHSIDNLITSDLDKKFNRIRVETPKDFLFFLNEEAYLERVVRPDIVPIKTSVPVVPINFTQYTELRGKTYKYPVGECWRLITNMDKTYNIEIIPPYNTKITSYTMRYIRKPKPIILSNILEEYGTTIDGEGNTLDPVCELPEAMHEEIVQRAVEIAKGIYRTGETETLVNLGQRSE